MADDRNTIHHCVPRSRGGINGQENTIPLRGRVHEAFHIVFGNKMPHEQVERLLEINCRVLSNAYKAKVYGILDLKPEFVYKDGLLIPKTIGFNGKNGNGVLPPKAER